MKFKQSPVSFNEETHTYMLGEKRLLGITGLIHSILGLGVYPDASDYTADFVIPRAGSRGTATHHAIQTFDELGVPQTVQTVRTKYGCEKRDNVRYVDETWDVSHELMCYIEHRDKCGFEPLANEHTVSDENKWASQIDNIWLRKETGGIWLVDTKTNNIDLYPTCGYFRDNEFMSGKEALKEYLSWQLSIYAELFERENPEMKVEGLACNWLRKDDAAFWVIERKSRALVKELLTTDYIFTDNGPTYFHHDPSVFGISSTPAVVEEKVPVVPEDVVGYIADLLKEEAELKAKMDAAKKALRAAMEENQVKSFKCDRFTASLSADSTTTAFDTTAFKKAHPDLYKSFLVEKTRKGSFTLKQKIDD